MSARVRLSGGPWVTLLDEPVDDRAPNTVPGGLIRVGVGNGVATRLMSLDEAKELLRQLSLAVGRAQEREKERGSK